MKKQIVSILIAVSIILSTIPANMASATPPGPTSSEQAVLSLLDYERVWNQLAYLSTFPEKVGGSPEEIAAQAYIYQQLDEIGMDELAWETFDSQSWVHAGTSLKVISPQAIDIPVTTYGASHSIWGTNNSIPYYFGNQDGGKTLVAPVVNAGFGTAQEYAALGDLSGKIVLVHRDDEVTLWPTTVLEEAALRNVAAVIFYGYYGAYPQVDSPQGEIILPDGIKQDTVGTSIPALSISVNAADQLKELLDQGPVTLQVEGRADILDESQAQSTNVIGILRGSKYPDEYVVFSTHIDTWWTGTLDDLSGVATLLEYARVFTQARNMGIYNNERSLVFAVFGSEEFGGPQETWFNWLVGSYEYVSAHPEVVNTTVIDLNLDMLSLKKSSGRYWIEQSPEANDFVSEAVADLGYANMIGYYNPIYSWVDGWSFYAKGGATSMNILWVTNADEIYHTQLDTMGFADPEPLRISLDLYTLLGMRADHALVLPINLMETIEWAEEFLSSDADSAPSESEYFAAASAALEYLREQVLAINEYSASLTAAYTTASSGERTRIEAEAAALNQALYTARKVINVWSVGEGGTAGSWDVFLRSHQHAHDLKYVNSAITSLQRGNPKNTLNALAKVYSMEWGQFFSRETYLSVMRTFTTADLYWGDDWDQQQDYVDVQGIYLGLRDGQLTPSTARSALQTIRAEQLIPWLRTDLATLKSAWEQAADILGSALP